MQHGDGPDETRRHPNPSGGSDEPDETQRLDDRTRRVGEPGEGGGPTLGGRYRLGGFIGSGGMADVHRATDLRLSRPVAVKVFRPDADPDGERRFHEEARMLANLSHPGLVALYDSGVDQQRLYLVMELVAGQSLRDVLDRQRLPLDEVVRIGTDVADVLTYVHEQRVVHRDIKPSNVLLAPDGRVRLTDFGISRLADAATRSDDDHRLGTVSYMAPEQVRGDHIGPAADVYALGLVLLEAVTGRVEYPGSDWQAASERLSRSPAVPGDLPESLRRALWAMTETDPQNRPTAAEAAEMLAGDAELRQPARSWSDAGAPRRSRAGRNLALALGVFALVVVLAVLAFVGLSDDESAESAQEGQVTDQPADDQQADEGSSGDGSDDGSDGSGGGSDGSGGDASNDTSGDTDGTGGDTGDGSGDGGLPELPDVDAPDLPNMPNMSDIGQQARDLWERFTNWFSGWF